MAQKRSTAERKADVLAALQAQRDLWLATADRSGRPQLIPVSAWWDGSHITIATAAGSRSAQNLQSTRVARMAIGSPDDTVVIDAELAGSVAVAKADSEQASGFASAVGWDPRTIEGDWVFLRLRPSRIQAYKGYDELAGRDLMTGGRWLS